MGLKKRLSSWMRPRWLRRCSTVFRLAMLGSSRYVPPSFSGYLPLTAWQWFEGLQQAVHGVGSATTWTCCVGNGSQELIHKAFQVFTDPGDPVLLET